MYCVIDGELRRTSIPELKAHIGKNVSFTHDTPNNGTLEIEIRGKLCIINIKNFSLKCKKEIGRFNNSMIYEIETPKGDIEIRW